MDQVVAAVVNFGTSCLEAASSEQAAIASERAALDKRAQDVDRVVGLADGARNATVADAAAKLAALQGVWDAFVEGRGQGNKRKRGGDGNDEQDDDECNRNARSRRVTETTVVR